MAGQTIGILGCGNLGIAILKALITAKEVPEAAKFDRYIACVRSQTSEERLSSKFPEEHKNGKLSISRGDNVKAVRESDIIILGVDPADVETTLSQEGLTDALQGKLVISIAAGWPREQLEKLIPSAQNERGEKRTWVLRTLPNVAAQVSASLTAIEDPAEGFPSRYKEIADAVFNQIGRTVHIAPRLMDATTAVGGSTPAFWAVICDAFIDAAVAVGVPRDQAKTMIYQSMKGTAEILQSGVGPGQLKEEGTSPEGCTIGGLMVLEEAGVRGHLARALREAVTIARLMGKVEHVNDTRRQG